jgi:CDP-diacylglycerol--glycerol-3-phosphate 3-phosphatidyltransferase
LRDLSTKRPRTVSSTKTKQVELKKGAASKPQRGQWDTRTDWARTRAEVILVPIVRALVRWGIHPNTVTILGLVLQIGVGIVFGLGYITLGGWLLLIVAPLDALDGAVARAIGKQSRFGAFLDSTLDRLSDAAVVLGLVTHYLRQGASTMVLLLLISLVAVLMVSYIRARAEASGFQCKIGLLTRLERIALIGVLSAIGLPTVMIWALMVLSVFTVMQRILYVYVAHKREEQGE